MNIVSSLDRLTQLPVNWWRYAYSQVEALYSHPLNKKSKRQIWKNFIVDQASARLGRARLQICPFLESSHLGLSTFTAPGIHWSRLGCMHDYEEMQLFADILTPEDVFIDVGANAGAFSVIAIARQCKRVIAFEPSSKTHWVAALAFRINGATPEAHQVRKQALGSQPGTAVITNNMGSTDHIISTKDPCPGPGSELVTISTLDSLINEINPANTNGFLAIKIDAEGHDLDILRGGLKLIKSAQECVLCVEMNINHAKIASLLETEGFTQVRYNSSAQMLRANRKLTASHNGLFIKGLLRPQANEITISETTGYK